MDDQLRRRQRPAGRLSPAEKRAHVDALSDVMWDLESQLAQVKAERAELMNSLLTDRQPGPIEGEEAA